MLAPPPAQQPVSPAFPDWMEVGVPSMAHVAEMRSGYHSVGAALWKDVLTAHFVGVWNGGASFPTYVSAGTISMSLHHWPDACLLAKVI